MSVRELADELKKGEGCEEAAEKSSGKQPRKDDDPEDQPPRKHSRTQPLTQQNQFPLYWKNTSQCLSNERLSEREILKI